MTQQPQPASVTNKPHQRLTTIFSHLAMIIFGLVFGLLVLEIAFRIIYPDPSPRLINQGIKFHEAFGHAFTPNTEGWNTSLRGEYSTYVKINGKGLRGREHSYEKEADTFRILVLGDSFTAGLQLPEAETFPSLLEAWLNQHYAQTNFEIINAGVIGYGTDKELAFFTAEGYRYQPDLVILAFFTGNDLTDNIWRALYKLENGALVRVPAAPQDERFRPVWSKEGTLFRNVRNFLYRNSRLYSVSIEQFTLSAVQNSPALAQFLISIGVVEITQPPLNYGNMYAFRYLPDIAWETTEALIKQLQQEVKKRGSQLLVVILPDETDIDDKRRQEIIEQYKHLTKNETIQALPPTQQLAEIMERADIAHLQLLPALRTNYQKNQEPLFFRYDGHWNRSGHLIAAQTIYDYLVKNLESLSDFPLATTQNSTIQN